MAKRKTVKNPKPTVVEMKRAEVILLTRSMQLRVSAMNSKIKTLSVVAQTFQEQVQRANDEMQNYLVDCRDVLKVPEFYVLDDITKGFRVKEKEQTSEQTSEGLDGIH